LAKDKKQQNIYKENVAFLSKLNLKYGSK
jgi:hypothetical protein